MVRGSSTRSNLVARSVPCQTPKMADSGDAPEIPASRIGRTVATLDPGYFAWVMATGIISIGADLLGYGEMSRVVFGVAIAAFVLLVLAYLARFLRYPSFVRQSFRDPTTAMAYFTVVAGSDVLATRFAMSGHTDVALGLGAFAALIWLVLTYGLPWSIVAGAHRPVLGAINGTWLIWVVSTQSLAIIGAVVAPHAPTTWLHDQLPTISVCLWGVGVMLYLILIVIIFLRLLLIEVTPAEMGPAYWIAMGATAISVRAAAGLLVLGSQVSSPVHSMVAEMRPFLIGISVVLWSFGSWWIPLLILFGIWRYVLRRYPRSYEPRLWSVVFPLGMYTVASWSLGKAANLHFMVTIARGWVWVGLAAWAVVLVMMVVSLATNDGGRQTSPASDAAAG